MSRLLRYIHTRVKSTKDGRQLRSGDVIHRKYSTLLQLTSIGAGSSLCVGSLLTVGQVARDVSGSGVLLSILVAVLAHFLCIQSHAELRSHFPRLQATLYEYVFHSLGELMAFLVAWSDLMVSTLYCASIWRAISANVDSVSGHVISNATATFSESDMSLASNIDPLACLFAICGTLYVALGGNTGPQHLFYHVTNSAMCAILVFLSVVGAFHVDFRLWRAEYVFQVQYTQILRGAAILLPMMLSQRQLLVSCDFMWLGIKPTVLRSLALSGVTGFVSHMTMACVLTLVSLPQSWRDETATVGAAFQEAGITWVKYVLGPVASLLLLTYGVLFLLGGVASLASLCKDGLLPQCQSPQNLCRESTRVVRRDSGHSLLGVLALGSLTAVMALLLRITLLLQTACVLVLLETLCVTCTVLALRYKPPEHIATICDNNNRSQPETTSLIEPTTTLEAVNVSPETYGALPSTLPSIDQTSDNEEDIDRVVQEYRLAHATHCHHGVVQTTPTIDTYRWACVAVLVFLLSVFVSAVLVQHGLSVLQDGRPVQVAFLVISLILAAGAILVLILKPMDRILPRTFMLKVPAVPALPLLTIATLAWLLTSTETTEALLAIGWLVLGLMTYVIHILCQRDAHYKELQSNRPSSTSPRHASGGTDLNTTASTEPTIQEPLDSHLMATFVTQESENQAFVSPGQVSDDDSLILGEDHSYNSNQEREVLVD